MVTVVDRSTGKEVRLNRKERRRMKKKEGRIVRVDEAGLPLDLELSDPAAELTEEEKAKVRPEIRACLEAGVDTDGYPLGFKMRREYERIIRDGERAILDRRWWQRIEERRKAS
jgi:hypothetical protein